MKLSVGDVCVRNGEDFEKIDANTPNWERAYIFDGTKFIRYHLVGEWRVEAKAIYEMNSQSTDFSA